MIPIQDQNPTSIRPYVNWALIAANVVIFIYTLTLLDPGNFICEYGLKPAEVTGLSPAFQGPCEQVGAFRNAGLLTFLTSMFLHGGLAHIGGNMLYLWIFGDNIEDLAGHIPYLAFYLTTGVVGSLAHIFSDPSSPIPAVGASGAISGVLGAYILRFPHAKVRTAIFLRFWIQFVRVPAWIMIGFWFLLQLVESFVVTVTGAVGGVAYFAHIGGFIAGFLFAFLLPKQKPRERWPGQTPYS